MKKVLSVLLTVAVLSIMLPGTMQAQEHPSCNGLEKAAVQLFQTFIDGSGKHQPLEIYSKLGEMFRQGGLHGEQGCDFSELFEMIEAYCLANPDSELPFCTTG